MTTEEDSLRFGDAMVPRSWFCKHCGHENFMDSVTCWNCRKDK